MQRLGGEKNRGSHSTDIFRSTLLASPFLPRHLPIQTQYTNTRQKNRLDVFSVLLLKSSSALLPGLKYNLENAVHECVLVRI